MKKKFQINTKNKSSKIIIESRSINNFLKSEFRNSTKKFLIIDSKVASRIKKILPKNKKLNIIIIKCSEKIKSIDLYSKITSELLRKKIDRSSTIIAIGGGTIGDLVGFVSSTILRGVRFILIPTTLLSQVDSSIGGKNGINTIFGKNLLGTFYQPDTVIIDPLILSSLSKRQIISGYAEILKSSLIYDKNFYLWLKLNGKKLILLEKNKLIYAISKSINIKKQFVINDEKEILKNSQSRAMLNFGHTFGHALEALNKYKPNLTHGEAIAIGMSIASRISYKLKNINQNEYQDILSHLKTIGLPTSSNLISNPKFFNLILSDKKNDNESVNLILLKNIGKAYYKKGLTVTKIKNLIN